jgi:hypothetical protein
MCLTGVERFWFSIDFAGGYRPVADAQEWRFPPVG